MKKLILILIAIPLISFSQEQSNKKNGLENLIKQAEKLVGNIDLDFNKKARVQSEKSVELTIINLWKNYSKAFEYKDYDKLASYFYYPSTFGVSSNPSILYNKNELIDRYKIVREQNTQEGYKYSLLENYEFYQLSENISILKAIYNRYNSSYNKIYSGKGIYFYKRTNDGWKLYIVDSIN